MSSASSDDAVESNPVSGAERWHDEHHGSGAPHYSTCWCCCTRCDPDWNADSPNPYFTQAAAGM